MKKILMIFIALAFLSSPGNAQLWKLRRLEAGAGLGTSQFYGDIGGYSQNNNLLGLKDFSFRHTRFNINTNLRYRILRNVSARVNLAGGVFHSTDARGSNKSRGFESRTLFLEPSLSGEYYFIKNKGENSYLSVIGQANSLQTLFSMIDCYLFAGFGALSYNVKPNDAMAPFATKRSGFTPVIPAGIGANLSYSGYVNIGVELGGRYSFSDNLDGYTSIHSKSNDVYYFLNFTFTYKIKTGKNGSTTF